MSQLNKFPSFFIKRKHLFVALHVIPFTVYLQIQIIITFTKVKRTLTNAHTRTHVQTYRHTHTKYYDMSCKTEIFYHVGIHKSLYTNYGLHLCIYVCVCAHAQVGTA